MEMRGEVGNKMDLQEVSPVDPNERVSARTAEVYLAPRGRFELPTFRLTAERSAVELTGNRYRHHNIIGNNGILY